MITQELLNEKLRLNNASMASSQALTSYCRPFRGAMGLVNDECKQSQEYKQLQAQFNHDWQALRAFNKANSKNKELQRAIKDEIIQRRLSAK